MSPQARTNCQLTGAVPLCACCAGLHGGQYKHEAPNLLVDTANIYPEIMHLDQLNVAKQCFTKGPQRLMSPYMRTTTATFVKGMGFKLDCKLKADGRSGTAWFKASQWNEVCRGSNKVPGGLPAWMSSLLFFIAEDFLEKQSNIRPIPYSAGGERLIYAAAYGSHEHCVARLQPLVYSLAYSPRRCLGRNGAAR